MTPGGFDFAVRELLLGDVAPDRLRFVGCRRRAEPIRGRVVMVEQLPVSRLRRLPEQLGQDGNLPARGGGQVGAKKGQVHAKLQESWSMGDQSLIVL